jgi:hypothetical protein
MSPPSFKIGDDFAADLWLRVFFVAVSPAVVSSAETPAMNTGKTLRKLTSPRLPPRSVLAAQVKADTTKRMAARIGTPRHLLRTAASLLVGAAAFDGVVDTADMSRVLEVLLIRFGLILLGINDGASPLVRLRETGECSSLHEHSRILRSYVYYQWHTTVGMVVSRERRVEGRVERS